MTQSVITVTIEGADVDCSAATAAQYLADILVQIEDGGYKILDVKEEKPKPLNLKRGGYETGIQPCADGSVTFNGSISSTYPKEAASQYNNYNDGVQ